MKGKQEILADVRAGLNAGVLLEDDLRAMLSPQPEQVSSATGEIKDKSDKLSAVDIMFYIAGIVLFSTIMSIIVQSWNDGNALVHIILSAGTGMILWMIAYYLLKSQFQNDIRKGLVNALLLTGSLSIIAGGYIITNEIIGGFGEVNFIAGAFTLAVLSVVHFGFDSMIKREWTLLMGIILGVATFPAFLFGLIIESDPPADLWALILAISAVLLAYATRVVAKVKPGRSKIHNSFDSFAAFLALSSMFVASFSDYGIIWLIVMAASVFGIFYWSIVSQNKHLLGNASFFMVVIVITISFKYFSGYGVTLSLIMATLGLLGSAAVASNINKKYFKNRSNEPVHTVSQQDQGNLV